MGTVEEGSRVATSLIDGLKQQPLALAVIVVNLCFLAFLTYIAHEMGDKNRSDSQASRDMIQQLVQACIEKRSENQKSLVFKDSSDVSKDIRP